MYFKNRKVFARTHTLLNVTHALTHCLGLQQACGLSMEQAARFTLHSLRVGGMDHLSKMGVPLGLCAQMMSHKSVLTARRYLRQFAGERIQELDSMVTV